MSNRQQIERLCLVLIDIIVIDISLILAYQIRFIILHVTEMPPGGMDILVLLWVIYIALFFLKKPDDDFYRRGYYKELADVMKTDIALTAIWAAALYFNQFSIGFSKMIIGIFFVSFAVIDYAARLFLKYRILRRVKRSRMSDQVLIVSDEANIDNVIKADITRSVWNRNCCGVVIVDKDMTGVKLDGVPVVCTGNKLVSYVIKNNVDEVFFTLKSPNSCRALWKWVDAIRQSGIKVAIDITAFGLNSSSGTHSIETTGDVTALVYTRKQYGLREMILKRMLDIAGGIVGCIIFAVSYVFLAPLIKLDSPGPVLFKQVRIGRNGRKFTIYKYRSMYKDAEARKAALMAQNEVKGLMFKMENDPRITRIGKFIRKTSLDELPQFWNVLKGEMALVGTRPPTVDEYEKYTPTQRARLSLQPGLTGLWQISGRSDIKDFDDVVKLDMQYIDNWTFGQDIKIILLTIKVVLLGRGSR